MGRRERLSVSGRALRLLAFVTFYGYIALLVVAGAWGAFGWAALDQRWLYDLDVGGLAPSTSASLLSQYRFLRAIELGYGTLAWRYRREIFTDGRFGRPFLGIMTAGVLARVVGLVADGRPKTVFFFFMISELIGVVAIFTFARERWSGAARDEISARRRPFPTP
jgi:hypothetical protein